MPKRTFQPKTRKAKRKHGFMARVASFTGSNILKRRRKKGRVKLSA